MKNKLILQIKKWVSRVILITEIILAIFGLYGAISLFQNNKKNIVYAAYINCSDTYNVKNKKIGECGGNNQCFLYQGDTCRNKKEEGTCSDNNQCLSGNCDNNGNCVLSQIDLNNSDNEGTNTNQQTTNRITPPASTFVQDCDPRTTQNWCKNGAMYTCSERGLFEFDFECDYKTCMLDNSRCADEDESPRITNGTFYQESNTKDSNFIPNYPKHGKGIINLDNQNLTIGTILSNLLPYIYVIAGLILLVMLIFGGIGLMTSVGNPDKTKAASGRITTAIIGFFIVFISYFVAKIVEIILGVKFM